MHAEFVIAPNGQRIFDRLPEIFGPRDDQAAAKSRILQHLTDKGNPRYYACEERPSYRLSAWWATSGSLRLIIEPTQSRGRRLRPSRLKIRNSALELINGASKRRRGCLAGEADGQCA